VSAVPVMLQGKATPACAWLFTGAPPAFSWAVFARDWLAMQTLLKPIGPGRPIRNEE
jgi:hypothetical protein